MELDAGADSHWKTRAVLRAQPPPEYSSPGLPVINQTSYTIFDELFRPQAFTHALDMSAYAAKFFNACTRVQGNVHNITPSYLAVTSAWRPVLRVSTSWAMFLASPYFSTSPSQSSLTMMSRRGFPKAARTGEAAMVRLGIRLFQSHGPPDPEGPEDKLLVWSMSGGGDLGVDVLTQ